MIPRESNWNLAAAAILFAIFCVCLYYMHI